MMKVRGALREAQRRWGASARVEQRIRKCEPSTDKKGLPICTAWPHHPRGCPLGRPLVVVGRFTGIAFCIEGSAETFEDAFAKVDANEARLRAQYARPAKDDDCRSCLGYGHIREDGSPSSDRRDRKCGDCRGEGTRAAP